MPTTVAVENVAGELWFVSLFLSTTATRGISHKSAINHQNMFALLHLRCDADEVNSNF